MSHTHTPHVVVWLRLKLTMCAFAFRTYKIQPVLTLFANFVTLKYILFCLWKKRIKCYLEPNLISFVPRTHQALNTKVKNFKVHLMFESSNLMESIKNDTRKIRMRPPFQQFPHIVCSSLCLWFIVLQEFACNVLSVWCCQSPLNAKSFVFIEND